MAQRNDTTNSKERLFQFMCDENLLNEHFGIKSFQYQIGMILMCISATILY